MTDTTINLDIGNGQMLVAQVTLTAHVVGPVPTPASTPVPTDEELLAQAIANYAACNTIAEIYEANDKNADLLSGNVTLTSSQRNRLLRGLGDAFTRVKSGEPALPPTPTRNSTPSPPLPTPVPTLAALDGAPNYDFRNNT